MNIPRRIRFVVLACFSYAVLASAWVVLSDDALGLLTDAVGGSWQADLKGLIFVLLTTGVLAGALLFVPASDSSDPGQSKRPWPLILVFGLAVVGIAAIAGLAFHVQSIAVKDGQFASLEAVARLKVDTITQWLAERRANAESVARNPVPLRVLTRWFAAKDPADLDWGRNFLDYLRISYGYRSISLRETSGRILLTVGDDPTGEEAIRPAIETALKTLQPALLDLLQIPEDGEVRLGMVAPLIQKDAATGTATVFGILVLENDPADFLFPRIQSWPVPSATGETLLFRRDGNDVLFLNDLRFRPDAALRFRWSADDRRLAAAAFLSNPSPTRREAVDYRGHPVLAAGVGVPGTSWILLAKQDTSEALAGLTRVWLVTGVLTSTALLFAGAGIMALWRRQLARAALDQAIQRQAVTDADRKVWHGAQEAAMPRDQLLNGAAGYFFAAAITVVTLLLRQEIDIAFGSRPLLILFLIPILLSAVVGGSGPGLFATVAAAATVDWFLIPPTHSFLFDQTLDLVQWSVLIVIGCMISLLIGALRRAQKLSEGGRLLQAVTLASIGDGIITSDRDGRVTFLNAEAERLTGWRRHEAVGEPVDRVFPLQRDNLSHRTGTVCPIEVKATPIRGPEEGQSGTVRVFRDISERRRVEAELRENESLYHTLFDDSPAPMLLVDPANGRIADANAAAVQYYGWDRGKLRSMLISEINTLAPDAIGQAMARADRSSAQEVFFFSHRLASGEIRDVEVHSRPLEVQGRRLLLSIVHDITERKRGEQALRESEERFAAVFRGSPVGIGIGLLETGIFVDVNPAWERLFGYTRDEVLGRAGPELRLWGDPELRAATFAALAESGGPLTIETDFRTKVGRMVDMLCSTLVITIAGRRHILALFSDLTERVRMERALREREASLTVAQSLARVGSWTANLLDGTIDASPEGAALVGRLPGTYPVADLFALIHPGDRERVQATWNAVPVSGLYESEYRIIVNGRVRWVHVKADVICDESKQAVRMIGMTHDITEMREAQLALKAANESLEEAVAARTVELRETQKYLQGVVDNIPALISYWDFESRNRFANRAYRTWLGIDPDTIRGRRIGEVLGDRLFEVSRSRIEAALGGETQLFEREIPAQDASEGRIGLVNYIPDVTEAGVIGFFSIVNDITAIKEAERSSNAARIEAERLARTKSEFLANMSHEIRTPMNAIMGLTSLLESSSLRPDQRDLVDKLRFAGRTLLGIINDVLDFSKIEAGHLVIGQETFRLDEVIDSVAAIMATAAGRKDLELVVGPVPREARVLIGDPLRLEQVIVNLVSNAIKFTERGVVSLAVIAEDRLDDRLTLRIVVSDTGIGIPAEKHEEIFSAFAQADSSTSRRFGGTGLGLSISKRIVELMGGRIGLSSEPGKGSEFWFALPFQVGSEPQSDLRTIPGQRLLIADDHPIALSLLAELVRGLGWSAEPVGSGRAAIDRAIVRHREGKPFDIMLIDWRMPDLDGLAVSRAIRSAHGDQQRPIIIMVTAFARDDLARERDCDIADVILTKPVTASALFNAVVEARQRRRGQEPVGPPIRSERLKGLRLLVVDDSDINLDVARRILESESAAVVIASNGQQAIDCLREQPDRFDAVLMDVQMPVLDGYQATRQIRDQLGLTSLPVIAVTAGAFQEHREAALEAGMTTFLAKPFIVDDLVRTIRQLTGAPAIVPAAAATAIPEEGTGAPVPKVPVALDADRGVGTWGDAATYQLYLHKFLNSYGDCGRELDALVAAGDPVAAGRFVHKLKGAAGNLALVQTEATAAAIERVFSRGGDTSGVGAQLAAAIEAARVAIEAFASRLQAAPSDPSDNNPPVARNPEMVGVLISELIAGLDRDRPDDAERALADLAAFVPDHQLEPVRVLVASFDFRAAEREALVLCHRLGLAAGEVPS